jgi:ribonuclease T2
VAVAHRQRNCSLNRLIKILGALALGCSPALAEGEPSGQFDYYALALSWSPTYCGSSAGENDASQCTPGRKFAFVVHGLWPQFDVGWPSSCPNSDTWVEKETIDGMMDIMPSKKLIIHEWKKHGVCSGKSEQEYFELTRQLFEKVRIPARYLSPNADVLTSPQQLVIDFVKTNKNLEANMLSVQCGYSRTRARLKELRVCFNLNGEFTKCGSNEERECLAKNLVMPQVR